MDISKFGYPGHCDKCGSFSTDSLELKVGPFYKEGNNFKLMLIGQDPTILNNPEKVKEVLMLDDKSSQLYRWLISILGKENFDAITVYATNLVKCSFSIAPSKQTNNLSRFLEPYFECCKNYMLEEIERYAPNLIITLGEPAHIMFTSLLGINDKEYKSMKNAYTGEFKKFEVNGVIFDYSPSLHIKTFRVAETYGDSVKSFKAGIKAYFNEF